MIPPVHCQLNNPQSLNLFGRVRLNSQQLRRLEATHSSEMKALYDAYSDVLNHANVQPYFQTLHDAGAAVPLINFNFEGRVIQVIANDNVRNNAPLNLDQFPQLEKAMARVCKLAKRKFPEAANRQADAKIPKPSPHKKGKEEGKLDAFIEFISDSWIAGPTKAEELRSEIKKINSTNHSDHEKALRNLNFFKDQLCLSEAEELEISLNPSLTTESKKRQARREKLDEKFATFSRSVGKDVAKKVAHQTDSLIRALNKAPSAGMMFPALNGAKSLIEEVDTASFATRRKQIALNCLMSILVSTIVGGFVSALVPVLIPLSILLVLYLLFSDSNTDNLYWKPTNWTNTKLADFSPPDFNLYFNGKNFNLDFLKMRFMAVSSSPDHTITINGKVKTFDQWLEILGLEELQGEHEVLFDYNLHERLYWFAVTIVHKEALLKQTMAKTMNKKQMGRMQQLNKTDADLSYNPLTGSLKIMARQRVNIADDASSPPYPAYIYSVLPRRAFKDPLLIHSWVKKINKK